MIPPCRFCYLLTVFVLIITIPAVHSSPVKILFDTDMDTDCDDTGALAILHGLANLGEAEILGTVVSSHFPYSAPCVEAINTYYNRPNIPIAASKQPGASIDRGSRYAKQVSERFPSSIKTNSDVPDAVSVYRQVLSKQKDNSVVLVTVGYLTNAAYLLESKPDDFSPLSGKDLVAKKIKLLVCMGGRYPSHLDPKVYGNFKPDPAAAVKVAKEWPGILLFSGLGNDIYTGDALKEIPDANPVKLAYKLYLGDKPTRPSWDPITVLYAVRPNEPFWIIQKEGYNHIFENGTNEWREQNKPNHWLLKIDDRYKPYIRNLLNALMVLPPIKP